MIERFGLLLLILKLEMFSFSSMILLILLQTSPLSLKNRKLSSANSRWLVNTLPFENLYAMDSPVFPFFTQN